jgi:acyl-CoA thioesterase-1
MAETLAALSRRTLLGLPWAFFGWPAAAAGAKVVTILGDSITAGLGLRAAESLPAQLHLALNRLGTPNVVRGAGVSGDTTEGGAARADFSIQPDTSVAIVALGANDLLRGIDPRVTRANLDRIITGLAARRIPVVLAGIRAPEEIGRNYARDFNGIFPSLARSRRVALYPDLLKGVARNPRLNQEDGIHPNAEGVRMIANGLAPMVARMLARRS